LREIQVKIYLPECIYRLVVWLTLLYRKLRYGYTFRRIPLTPGKFSIVDAEDYESLSKHKWCAGRYDRRFYTVRKDDSENGKRRRNNIMMHRQIL